MKKKALSLAFILIGIIGIISAAIVTPEFAEVHLSSDNHLEPEGIKELQRYRLLSLVTGFFLIFMGILIYKLPDQYLYIFGYRVFFAAVVVYLVIFGYNVLTRTHDFGDPDTMNYVDIARNIANGQGIAQSALGFNQSNFSANDRIPMPLVAQPPLYPLLIAFFSLFGLSFANAGLLISILSYGLILLLVYRLSLEICDMSAALLSVALLLLYAPLYKLAQTAFSDLLCIVLVLTSFLLLLQIRRSTAYHLLIPAMAGITAGLSYATRYAMLPLFFLSVLFIVIESNRKLRDLTVYASGFAIPAGLVLMRNFFVSGVFQSPRNPSTVDLKSNALIAFEVVTREHNNMLQPDLQAMLIVILAVMIIILLFIRHKIIETIQTVFFEKRGYILALWVIGYLAFLILARSKYHLDPINFRLVAPAGIIIFLLLSVLIVKATRIRVGYLLFSIIIIIVLFIIKNEARVSASTPIYNQNHVISMSERLTWVAKNTSDRDLIIGDGTVDFAFYFARPSVISFSPYPEAIVPEYNKIIVFCNNNCKKHENIYLIVRPPEYLISRAPDMQDADPNDLRANLKQAYGTFISDILFGEMHKYPAITFLERLSDAHIYKIACQAT
jgi:hypothetical protein